MKTPTHQSQSAETKDERQIQRNSPIDSDEEIAVEQKIQNLLIL